jgi:hypothetical protein
MSTRNMVPDPRAAVRDHFHMYYLRFKLIDSDLSRYVSIYTLKYI